MSDAVDILLSQRFLPEFGGSIRWMYEVYRRWPRPVQVITHDYYSHPPGTPECPGPFERPGGSDHVTDANLAMDRRNIFLRDWGVERPAKWQRYLRMTRAVHQRLRDPANRGRQIIVHCTHAVPEVVSLLPLKWRYGRRLKIVCYAHGEEVTACCSSRQLTLLMHRGNAAVDLMLANSRYTQGVLAGHVDAKKVRVVHPGVELAEFSGAAQDGINWRHQKGYDGRRIVLTLGRLDPRKNHAAVLEAVAKLQGRYPDLLYVLAGEGRQGPALREQARKLGVESRVIFAGSVSGAERIALYGACDLFAMPAIQDGTDVEGFGMVFLEAGASGKPSIAGCTGGQADAVIDGKTGLIVDGRSGEQVAAALDRLLGDDAQRQQLGRAARAHAEQFDWPRVVERTVALVAGIAD